jgi:hypothetical protein
MEFVCRLRSNDNNLHITNSGAAQAEGVSVVSDNTEFVVSNLSNTTIPVDGSVTFDVTFTPNAAGARSATLTATSTTGGDPATYPITGTGLALPSISGQPTTPAATCSGSGTQILTVTATAAGIQYSWTKDNVPVVNGGVYSGQGTATLTLINATANEAGVYRVIVSGTCTPPVTSDPVTVTVNPLPIQYNVGGTTSICANTSADITLSNSDVGVNYQLRNNSNNAAVGSPVAGTGSFNHFTNRTFNERYYI